VVVGYIGVLVFVLFVGGPAFFFFLWLGGGGGGGVRRGVCFTPCLPIAGSVTVYVKTTVYCTPDSSMVLTRQVAISFCPCWLGLGNIRQGGIFKLYTVSSSCSTGRSYPHHWKDAGMEGLQSSK
jgi:hypothetical protein